MPDSKRKHAHRRISARRGFFQGLCLVALGVLCLAGATARAEEGITKSWAIAEFGTPLYQDGFEHWPYANPDAPKGGRIVLGAFGSFDSLNPIILKGEWPRSIGLISDSLMTSSADELSVAYGLIAETAEYPADKSWIVFNLRPEARYHDGTPITADDFKFGFDTIRAYGRPFLKSFYEEVETVEVLGEHRLKFTFNTRDSMKPLLKVASLSPLPRHYWAERDISQTFLEPPLTSGAYRVARVDPGRSITYERVEDYWAADLPVNRGLNNFDRIRYDYYRDQSVEFEAFKAGEVDFRREFSSKHWVTGYEIKQVEDGRIIKRTQRDETPQGIQAFFFNLRDPKFQDARVREAIGYLFDFETIQRHFLYGQRTRAKSFFPNSDFGVSGPPSEAELAILEPYRDQLPPDVFTKAFEPPKTDGSGRIRGQLRQALRLFKAAGWVLQDRKLVDGETGEQMKIEFLLVSRALEGLTSAYVKNLTQAGIDASLRIVDTSQYENRLNDFDFDMVIVRLNFFPPPGPELRSYYGSAAARVRGSANIAGIENPVVDALIEQIIAAPDLETLKAASRALDRVLLWNHYVVPQYYAGEFWFAYQNKFGFPERAPRYAIGFPGAWWIDRELAQNLGR